MPSDPPSLRFQTAELAECAEREVRMRERVYPVRMAAGRLSAKTAMREIAMMKAIAKFLRGLADKERLI